MEQAGLTPRDYIAIARRRKWFFIIPAGIVLVGAILAALLWPPTYRSTATVLIEQAEVPQDLVNSVITDYIERRLESITRKVMVTENLLRIIERYGLYTRELQRMPQTDVAEMMRDDIRMNIVSADVSDPRSGRTTPSTVAFTVSFDYGTPETAQRVANELVSLYLNENLRQRRQRATETASFLNDERERIDRQIGELFQKFADYKTTNNGSLPDQLPFNEQRLARAEQELRDINRQVQALQEREAYTQVQLALTEPYQLYAVGARSVSPRAQLEDMRTQLASLRARYGPAHPDVIRTGREVAALEQTLGTGPGLAGAERQVRDAQINFDTLRQRYTADHPDVLRAQRELASAQAALTEAQRGGGGGGGSDANRPDNPAYIQLQSELNSIRAELPALSAQRDLVMREVEQTQALILKAPAVEREYTQLSRAIEGLSTMREDLTQRQMAAQLGQNLEVELKGERFSLIEPPLLPTDPVRPRRLLILAIGFILAGGAGGGVAVSRHLLDDAVHTSRDMALILGETPLSVVPRIMTRRDRTRIWTLRIGIVALLSLLVAGALWWVHTQIIPLDILFYDLQRRFVTQMAPLLPGTDGGTLSTP